jgi:hypothetical protein
MAILYLTIKFCLMYLKGAKYFLAYSYILNLFMMVFVNLTLSKTFRIPKENKI